MKVCKKICTECPFHRDSVKGYVGPYKNAEELHRIVMNELPFSCHMKQGRDIEFHEAGTKRFPLCRGGLAYIKKNAKLPKNPELRKATEAVTKDDRLQVMSTPEFIKHHTL